MLKGRQQRIDRVLAKALGLGREAGRTEIPPGPMRNPSRESRFSLRSFRVEDDELYARPKPGKPVEDERRTWFGLDGEMIVKKSQVAKPQANERKSGIRTTSGFGEQVLDNKKQVVNERKSDPMNERERPAMEVSGKQVRKSTDWEERFLPNSFMNR